MNRRDVLKAVTFGLPAAAALGPSNLLAKAFSASAEIRALNLIIEGPFLCLLRDTQAEILAPRVAKHLYQIEHSGAEQGTYRLNGAQGSSNANLIQYTLPHGAEAFRLSLEQLHLALNRDKTPYFSFLVPLPKQIVAVLSRQAEIVDAFGQRRNVMMPTAYAFVYDISDTSSLRLEGDAEWNPERKLAKDGAVNLSVSTACPWALRMERESTSTWLWQPSETTCRG